MGSRVPLTEQLTELECLYLEKRDDLHGMVRAQRGDTGERDHKALRLKRLRAARETIWMLANTGRDVKLPKPADDDEPDIAAWESEGGAVGRAA